MDRIDALFIRAPRFYTDGVTGVIFPDEALYPTILESNGFTARFLNPEIAERKFQARLYTHKKAYILQDRLLKDFINNEEHPRWRFLSFYVESLNPRIVFILHLFPSDFSVTLKTAEIIKKLNPNILVVSLHLSKDEAKIYLKNSRFIDVSVFGEPEYTILEIMREVKLCNFRKNIRKIKGIVFKDKGMIFLTGERKIEKNLDNFPIPNRDLVIRKEWYLPSAFGIVEISRGCVYSCNFCEMRPPLRMRSPEKVIEEIMMIMKKYKTREFKLMASSLLHNIDWMKKFCRLIREKKLKFIWSGFINMNQINEDIIKCMKSSGLVEVGTGIESGSTNILQKLNKAQNIMKIQYQHAYRKFEILKRNGILCRSGIIFGIPEEKVSDIIKNIKIIRMLRPDFFRFQFLVPKIGTVWFKKINRTDKEKILDKLHTGYSFFVKERNKAFYYDLWSKMEELSSLSEKNYLLKRFLNLRILFFKLVEYFQFLNLYIVKKKTKL